MYRQFESSDKPKSAARLLAEEAFAPSASGRRSASDATAPVVTVVNRRLALLSRSFRQASNDAQPVPAATDASPDAQIAKPAAKPARVFLLQAPAGESPADAAPDTAAIWAQPEAATPLQAEAPAADHMHPLRRTRARRYSPHGPVRVIYSAPPATPADPAHDDRGTGISASRLESILQLQNRMAEIESLLADIQLARDFEFGNPALMAELQEMTAQLDSLSDRFPTLR